MFVYVITCATNGKQYVGKACMPKKRWNAHKASARAGHDTPLYRAMRLYGVQTFDFDVVEQCKSEAESFQREVAWIEKLNCTVRGNGYNQTTGGEGLSGCLPETRRRMSEAKRGKSPTPSALAARVAGNKGNGKKAKAKARALEMYEQGFSTKEIANEIQRTPVRVGDYLREAGIRPGTGHYKRGPRGKYRLYTVSGITPHALL